MLLKHAISHALVWGTLLAGCAEPVPTRQFDTIIDCTGPLLVAVSEAEALSRLDVDGDGEVTPADLSPGESVAILRMPGTHIDFMREANHGVSIHSDRHAYVVEDDEDLVLNMSINCMPTSQLALAFDLADLEDGSLQAWELTGFAFSSDEANAATSYDVQAYGDIEGYVSEGRLSGILRGFAAGALYSSVPEEVGLSYVTGQSVQVEALVFRDIEVVR